MNLYEYDAALEQLFDEETGEILDYEAYVKLDLERSKKISNTALLIKNLSLTAKNVKQIADDYKEKAEALEKRAARVKEYLTTYLSGEKFKDEKITVYYTKSVSTEVDENTLLPDEYMTIPKPEFNKAAIKKALQSGIELDGCKLVEKTSLVVR